MTIDVPFDQYQRYRVTADLATAMGAGVRVLADSFSLKERGIDENRLAPGVAAAPLDVVLDALAEGAKVIWH